MRGDDAFDERPKPRYQLVTWKMEHHDIRSEIAQPDCFRLNPFMHFFRHSRTNAPYICEIALFSEY
jgi:hypothetical protein